MDLICREQTIEKVKDTADLWLPDLPHDYRQGFILGTEVAVDTISYFVPPAEKTGKWIHERLPSTVGGTYPVTRCSVCQNTMPFEWETPYCPNCGTRMVTDESTDRSL